MFTVTRKKSDRGQPSGAPPRPVDGYRVPPCGVAACPRAGDAGGRMRLAPWHVKGIDPRARETAREAARRSGMSVGQWLTSVIHGQAGAQGAAVAAIDDEPQERRDNIASITQRLDALTRQLDRLAKQPP